MRNPMKDWSAYETTIRRMVNGSEISEIKYFSGSCVESVLKVVDWYYNDHLAEQDKDMTNTVWVFELVNEDNPRDKLRTPRPFDWPDIQNAIVA